MAGEDRLRTLGPAARKFSKRKVGMFVEQLTRTFGGIRGAIIQERLTVPIIEKYFSSLRNCDDEALIKEIEFVVLSAGKGQSKGAKVPRVVRDIQLVFKRFDMMKGERLLCEVSKIFSSILSQTMRLTLRGGSQWRRMLDECRRDLTKMSLERLRDYTASKQKEAEKTHRREVSSLLTPFHTLLHLS